MKIRNLSVAAAIAAAALIPAAANAGTTTFQYLFQSGKFSYNIISGFGGTEIIDLQNANDTVNYGTGSLSLSGQPSNLTAILTPGGGSSHFVLNILSGVWGPAIGKTMSGNFSFGMYSVGQLPGFVNLTGHGGEFTLSSANYQTVGGSHYNGSGAFNGFINVNGSATPELGTSAGMITMLMGAGFMGRRRRMKTQVL